MCFWQLWTCQMSQTVDKQSAVRVNTCSSWAAECSNTSQLLLFFCTNLDPQPLTETMKLTWWYRFCLDMFISLPWTYPSVYRLKYGAFQILHRNTNKTNKADKHVLISRVECGILLDQFTILQPDEFHNASSWTRILKFPLNKLFS